MADYYECPHCQSLIEIHKNEINCGIFRHAVYKDGLRGISPHAPREECERLVKEDLVYGCAKPFQIDKNTYKIQSCGYI